VIFVTGTGTGVGKTTLTGLLLGHLRRRGIRALAMKPFASGPPADTRLLWRLQQGAVAAEAISPFRFRLPVAPLVAARAEGRRVSLDVAAGRVLELAGRCECLLVEGCGGLLTPLGPAFTALELMARAKASALVAARNRLGVLNHAIMAHNILCSNGIECSAVVLMATPRGDASTATNGGVLRRWLRPTPVFEVPFLGPARLRLAQRRRPPVSVQKTLAELVRRVKLRR
jgi:dethiobiotin synthetase